MISIDLRSQMHLGTLFRLIADGLMLSDVGGRL